MPLDPTPVPRTIGVPGFTPSLKTVKVDDRGRVNIGSVVSDAKGRTYGAAVDPHGQILLMPLGAVERAVEVPRG